MSEQDKKYSSNGYDTMLMGYAQALEDNSSIIATMLSELTKKQLSVKEKKQLKSIKRDLTRIDKYLDGLGG